MSGFAPERFCVCNVGGGADVCGGSGFAPERFPLRSRARFVRGGAGAASGAVGVRFEYGRRWRGVSAKPGRQDGRNRRSISPIFKKAVRGMKRKTLAERIGT